MTKADEIQLLKHVIRQFGPDSYIGPFLLKHQRSIERAISNDLAVEVTLNADESASWTRHIRR